MNSINEIQRQYTYAIQPVKFFETENSKAAQGNVFSFISKINENKSGYNPFHPNVLSEQLAKNLDLTC